MTTTIEWTWCDDGKGGRKKGETWNPIRGCTAAPNSPACNNCYAEAMAGRFDKPGLWGHGLTTLRANGERRWSGKVGPYQPLLSKPLHWRDPRGVFVNSTSDVFHEKMMETEAGRRYIAAMFGVMAATPQHTYMILTKRPHLMREWFSWIDVQSECQTQSHVCTSETYDQGVADRHVPGLWAAGTRVWPLPNVWLGATTENQDCADRRIPDLLATPAAVRFLSCEPLLGPIDLGRYLWQAGSSTAGPRGSGMGGQQMTAHPRGELGWVITGGESGTRARPSHPDWFRSIRDQCAAAGVAYFHKQMGEWTLETDPNRGPKMIMSSDGSTAHAGKRYKHACLLPVDNLTINGKPALDGKPDRVIMHRPGKKAAGRLLDGREWNEFPDV